jgi:hypothetical protein
MPRTTLDIDASVLRELKRRQKRTGQTLGQLVSELVATALAADDREPGTFDWKTAAMRARVDLEDKDALRDALDRA